jgi:uncharacterized membrane protein YhfC
VAVQLPLMIVLPILLGLAGKRWMGEPMSVWLLGALTFVLSQVVHLPLNFALGLLGPPRGVALLPLPVVGAVAGLSAGVCEEVARFLSLRFLLKERRKWQTGVQFGLGHGGIEAIVFGVLAALGLVNMLLAPYAEKMGLSLDDQASLRHAARQYWEMQWSLPVLAGYERVAAIVFHVGASTLVLRGVVRRHYGYLVAAILLHAALDAPIVFLHQVGIGPIYGWLTVCALGMAVLCWFLRTCWKAEGLDAPASVDDPSR